MRHEINRSLDLFDPGRSEDDTEWADLVQAVKQVTDCRRQEEEEEGQSQEMRTLIEEVKRLKAIVSRQGEVPHLAPIPTIVKERGETSAPMFRPRPLEPSAHVFRPKPLEGPTEGFTRTFRCMWCDSLDHARKECEDFKRYFRDQIVKFVEMKLVFADSGELIPTNFGKGGMKVLVDK